MLISTLTKWNMTSHINACFTEGCLLSALANQRPAVCSGHVSVRVAHFGLGRKPVPKCVLISNCLTLLHLMQICKTKRVDGHHKTHTEPMENRHCCTWTWKLQNKRIHFATFDYSLSRQYSSIQLWCRLGRCRTEQTACSHSHSVLLRGQWAQWKIQQQQQERGFPFCTRVPDLTPAPPAQTKQTGHIRIHHKIVSCGHIYEWTGVLAFRLHRQFCKQAPHTQNKGSDASHFQRQVAVSKFWSQRCPLNSTCDSLTLSATCHKAPRRRWLKLDKKVNMSTRSKGPSFLCCVENNCFF